MRGVAKAVLCLHGEEMSSPAKSPSLSPVPFPISERELVFLLAMIQALHALAIDTMLPALGDISRDLVVSDPNRRQLVVGLFLFGLGAGALFPGAFADRFGRKRVLLVCIGGYVALSLISALAWNFTVLAVIRLAQGFLSSGMSVVPNAIIRDRFEGDRMARLQSLVSVVFMTVPMIAPSIGQPKADSSAWWNAGPMNSRSSPSFSARLARPRAQERYRWQR